MLFLRESCLLLRNTALVTLAVVLGFAIGGALGIPEWFQALCLLPAGYLFCRLSGEKLPGVWTTLGFLALLAGISFMYREVGRPTGTGKVELPARGNHPSPSGSL